MKCILIWQICKSMHPHFADGAMVSCCCKWAWVWLGWTPCRRCSAVAPFVAEAMEAGFFPAAAFLPALDEDQANMLPYWSCACSTNPLRTTDYWPWMSWVQVIPVYLAISLINPWYQMLFRFQVDSGGSKRSLKTRRSARRGDEWNISWVLPLKGYPRITQSRIIILTYPGLKSLAILSHLIQGYASLYIFSRLILGYSQEYPCPQADYPDLPLPRVSFFHWQMVCPGRAAKPEGSGPAQSVHCLHSSTRPCPAPGTSESVHSLN